MNFENQFNAKALDFYAMRGCSKIPTDAFIRNCSPTHLNPVSAKQMQFNSWTNFTSDNNSDRYVRYSSCGDKTPNQKNLLRRKKMAMEGVCSSQFEN